MKQNQKGKVSSLDNNVHDLQFAKEIEPVFYERIKTFDNVGNKSVNIRQIADNNEVKISDMVIQNVLYGSNIANQNFKKLSKRGNSSTTHNAVNKKQKTSTTERKASGVFITETNNDNSTSSMPNIKVKSSTRTTSRKTRNISPTHKRMELPLITENKLTTNYNNNIINNTTTVTNTNSNNKYITISINNDKKFPPIKRKQQRKQQVPEFLNIDKVRNFLDQCQEEINNGNSLSNRIDTIHKEKYDYKKIPIYLEDSEQKEIEKEIVENIEHKYISKKKKLEARRKKKLPPQIDLEAVRNISNRFAYLNRKLFFADLDQFTPDNDFYFDKELIHIQQEMFREVDRQKLKKEIAFDNMCLKAQMLLFESNKARDNIMSIE